MKYPNCAGAQASLSMQPKMVPVMDIESFAKRESALKLREMLLRSELERASGKPGHSVDEVAQMMESAIQGVADAKRG